MSRSLEEFIGKYQHPSDKEAMRIAIEEAIRVCEEYIGKETEKEITTPGNVGGMWSLLYKLKSWAGEIK